MERNIYNDAELAIYKALLNKDLIITICCYYRMSKLHRITKKHAYWVLLIKKIVLNVDGMLAQNT